MFKVFIDGKLLQAEIRACRVREGQEFHLKVAKIEHNHLGQWVLDFETLKRGKE